MVMKKLKWSVIVTYDASRRIVVEAENEEQAKEAAMNQAPLVCLCHQCARELDVGDALEPIEAIETSDDDNGE